VTSEDPAPGSDEQGVGAAAESSTPTGTGQGAPSEGTPIPQPRGRRRRPSILTITGLLLIAIGLGSLGWMGYQYFGTNGPAQEAAKSEVSQLQDQWNSGDGIDVPDPSATASSTPGATSTASASKGPKYTQAQLDKAMAILTIPKFGADYRVPILVGTSDYALGRGVGWYESTQLPGQIGNFAIAGHRITHGEPFARLLELQPGDKVIIETKTYIFTYVIDESPSKLTVKDVDTWVIDPVPGKTGIKATQALITLTTCQDLFRSPDRSVGFGHLVDTKRK
jgi:sortase A